MTSLICTHCARGSHLSCHHPTCQCPCRDERPDALHEVSEDLTGPDREDGAA